MIPNTTPAEWTDRKLLFLDNPDRPEPLEERVKLFTDSELLTMAKRLTVVAFDPGGTTGWSLMMIDYDDLKDPRKSVQSCLRRWYHGGVDCGSNSGDAADSASATGYDLGISETGEAAGIAICENIVGEALAMAAGPVAVVIEDFIIDPDRMNMGRDFLSPVRTMSRLEQLLWESRSTTVHKQMPSEKPTASDERLVRWGMYTEGKGHRHARDADRHALIFLRKLKQKQGRIRTAFPQIAEARNRGLL